MCPNKVFNLSPGQVPLYILYPFILQNLHFVEFHHCETLVTGLYWEVSLRCGGFKASENMILLKYKHFS